VLRGDRMPALQEHTVVSYKVFGDHSIYTVS